MGWLESLRGWCDENKDVAFDLMRIYLGIGLFVKGIQFIGDRDYLLAIMQDSETIEFKFRFLETFLGHYIPLAHLGGGLLLAAGLMTRISTLFQLPVLGGAVLVVAGQEGIFSHNQEFQFTALVLTLLLLILFHGPGRLSVDHYLKTH